MPKLVVNYPNIALGTELEVQGYGLFRNGTINEVEGPLYQNTRFKNDDGEWFEDIQVDTLVLGQPLDVVPVVTPVVVDDEGDN